MLRAHGLPAAAVVSVVAVVVAAAGLMLLPRVERTTVAGVARGKGGLQQQSSSCSCSCRAAVVAVVPLGLPLSSGGEVSLSRSPSYSSLLPPTAAPVAAPTIPTTPLLLLMPLLLLPLTVSPLLPSLYLA